MLLEGPPIHDDVVEIHQALFVLRNPQYAVHQPTECTRQVAELEAHDPEVIEAVVNDEGSLLTVGSICQ